MDNLGLRVKALEDEIERLRTKEAGYGLVLLDTPLIPINSATFSTAAISTEITATSLGTPANAKAIMAQLFAKDSAAGASTWFSFGPSATYYYAVSAFCNVNNLWAPGAGEICATDANGSVWYRAAASGANTLTVLLRIWGYWL